MGSTMGSMDEFGEALKLLHEGVQPVIDSVYESEDAAKAFARLETGEQFGKVVIRWT